MSGWTQLQSETSALRAPDEFTTPRSIGPNGAHLPAKLHDLAQASQRDHSVESSADVFLEAKGDPGLHVKQRDP